MKTVVRLCPLCEGEGRFRIGSIYIKIARAQEGRDSALLHSCTPDYIRIPRYKACCYCKGFGTVIKENLNKNSTN